MAMKLTRKDRKQLEFILGRVQAARADLNKFILTVPACAPGPDIYTLGERDKKIRESIGNSKYPEHLQAVSPHHTILRCGLEDSEQALMQLLYDTPRSENASI